MFRLGFRTQPKRTIFSYVFNAMTCMAWRCINRWNNPWRLGDKIKGGNCSINEAYGNFKGGYRAFERSVNLLCERLDGEPTEDNNLDWHNVVSLAIYTICVLCLEAVRFPVLKFNFATFLLIPELEDRDLTTGEGNCIRSWKKMSRCVERAEPPYPIIEFSIPITPEFVMLAEKDPNIARACVLIRHTSSPRDQT